MDDPALKRALQCVRQAQEVCPRYGAGFAHTPQAAFDVLCSFVGLSVETDDLGGVPAVLLPFQDGGFYRLLVDNAVHRQTRDTYLVRHEIGHILAEDAHEPLMFRFPPPLPEAEMVADLFAMADLVSDLDFEIGHQWVEWKIRRAVVLHENWYLRIPRIIPLLKELRAELAPPEGQFRIERVPSC